MSFSLKFSWRDTRRSRRKLTLAGLAVALGVGAMVAVASLGESFRTTVESQSRALVGADAVVSSRFPLTPEAGATLKSLGAETAREVSLNSMIVLPGKKGTQFVSVRATESMYPFYGDIGTEPAGAAKALADGGHVLLDESVMSGFGLKPGDAVSLGSKTFRIAGALKTMPGDTVSFATISPRLVLPLPALAGTGISEFGPLVRHRVYLKFPAGTDADAAMKSVSGELKRLKLRYDTTESRSEQLGKSIDTIADFLRLAGFVTLLLGSVGVAGAMRTHIREKIATIATLRCLGASSGSCFRAYLFQAATVGFLGSAAGVFVGLAARYVAPALFRGWLPVDVPFAVSRTAIGGGFSIGFAVCLLFALPPLLAVRRVSPLAAIRSEYEPERRRIRIPEMIVHTLCALAVVGFSYLQTGTWQRASGFSGGVAVMLATLALTAKALTAITRRTKFRRAPYAWRQGVSNLHRPENRTTLLLVTMGLGAGLLLTLGLARATVPSRVGDLGGASRPDLMLFDIQSDQMAPLRAILGKNDARELDEAPVVTMRISSVNGRPVSAGGEGGNWSAFTHEYRSTYRAKISETERIVAGRFEPRASDDATVIPVSLETGVAKKLGVGLGSEIVFDIQGVPFRTRVASLREVEWRRFSPNFFVVFPEGVLEDAPQMHVMAVKAASPEIVAGVRRDLTGPLSNISAIDLASVLRTLDTIFGKIASVVRFVALFTFGTGAIVLAGAMLAGRDARLRESVLLRTLGASAAQVTRILLVEYALIGVLAAGTGATLAFVANAALAKFVFDAPAAYDFPLVAETFAGVVLLAVVTGLATGRGATRRPPLEVLREE